MKYNTLLILFLILTSALKANTFEDWGPTGHRVVGEIAEQHLSKKARKKINKILQGNGLAYVANFADEIKSDKNYDSFKTWHYVNFPFDQKYHESEKSNEGDIIMGIQTCIDKLKDEQTSATDESFYLKMLIHLVGDLHQPLHIGLAEDKGGNDFQVRWFSDGSNLHRVWDSEMIDSFKMSYTEMAENIVEGSVFNKSLAKGSVTNWAEESRVLTKDLYTNVKPGDKLGYNHSYQYFSKLEKQLYLAGIRLAEILNDIYG